MVSKVKFTVESYILDGGEREYENVFDSGRGPCSRDSER